MEKLCLIVVSVLLISSFLFPQGKSSIQFTGGVVKPLNSFPGLSGTVQYNYNLNKRLNLFIAADYSEWDKKHYSVPGSEIHPISYSSNYSESDHSQTRIMAGGRYIVIEPAKFRFFIEAGIGYSWMKYNFYVMKEDHNPDNTYQIEALPSGLAVENQFDFSSGIGVIHPMTDHWDIMVEFKLNTYLNSEYSGLFTSNSTTDSYSIGFNYRI